MEGGICLACHQFSQVLIKCSACGAVVCPDCVHSSGFCKLCKGKRFI